MVSKKRSVKAKVAAAAPTAKEMDVQLREFQSAVAQFNDAVERLGKVQLCYECSCGPCNECTVCSVCRVCKVCKICKVCKVCNVCYECSCGPCAAGA